MAIFGQYQGGDSFQVGPNMQGVIAGQKAVHESMYNGVEKIIQAKQEMDVLRSTTQSVLSQYSADESGKPSPAAPKYIHDLYKSVEKEGGIQGLSKSSLVAVLKGYETGLQVDGQRMQIQAAQQQATLRGYEIDKAEREADEFKRIAFAHKLAFETMGTPSAGREVATAPTTAYNMSAETGEEIYKYLTGQRATDPRLVKPVLQPTPAPAKVAPTPKPVSQNSPERDALEAKLNAAGAAKLIGPLEKELSNLNNQLNDTRSPNVTTKTGNYESNAYGFILPPSQSSRPKQLDEIRADKTREPDLVNKINAVTNRIAETKAIAEAPESATTTARPAGAVPVAPKPTSSLTPKAQPSVQPTPQAQPAPRAVNSNPSVKSDDEKIAEEYGMLTSRLKERGGVPMNWSESTFREIRGYAPKVKIMQQGPITLVGIGDKWQVVKTGAENQLSPSELATTEKHMVWKDSIRTDKLSNKNWTFRGDIRTTEADTAGKVKKAVTDTTRALEALDKLIDLGETGFWDSITPSDKAGVISGVTNSVQAAGRTEIAGSGAFSEQDAKKLESIVPDMSSISGAVFREKSLTMLKTYRERMARQVGDIGRTWGFEVAETKSGGLTDAQIAAMRDKYTELVKQGYNHEDAKKLALESLNQ
jgi:hypothetical protein